MLVIGRTHSQTMNKARELISDSLFEIADAMLDLDGENEALKDRIDDLEKLLAASEQSA